MCGFFTFITNVVCACGIYVMWNINQELVERVEKLERDLEKNEDKNSEEKKSWF